jgi:hypothetical protein
VNIDDYREGYEDGVEASKIPGRELTDLMFGQIWSPSYRKGYLDGLHGRPFKPGEEGWFNTCDTAEPDEEVDEESDTVSSPSSYARTSSGEGYSGSEPSAPVPLTESDKRKILIGRVILVSAFCVSTAFDVLAGNPITLRVLGYASFVAVMSYVAYRVAYRAKYWLIPLLIYNVLLFVSYKNMSKAPFLEVFHRMIVSNISLLVGVALIYGIYKFFTL